MDEISPLRIVPRHFQIKTEVLKEGEIFLTTLPTGEVPDGNMGGLGLYYRDTRYLSGLEMYLADAKPVLLSSTTRGSHFSQFEFTNPEISLVDGQLIPLQTLHLRLLRVIRGALFQRLRLINFNFFPVTITLRFLFAADYVDIFEVSGMARQRRGEILEPRATRNSFQLRYRGLDDVVRITEVFFDPAPAQIRLEQGRAKVAVYLHLPPQKKVYLICQVTPRVAGDAAVPLEGNPAHLGVAFSTIAIQQAKSYRKWTRDCTQIETDNQVFNQILKRATTDLRSLFAVYPEGGILEAGVPWYAAPFGRDALVSSWQTLMLNREIARSSLRFLARFQGRRLDPSRDEQPGKIMHELRRGEMAACGEIVHTPYYGSVDSTLWFVILLGELYCWDQDRTFVEEMHEALKGCLTWCREYGDLDGDGYIEYRREAEGGLDNQGWKDSWDGVVDAEGRIPEPPIALVEVQGYLYLALRHASRLLTVLGESGRANEVAAWAERLRAQFLKDFWLGKYLAFALDGRKLPVTTVVSNMGHCLFTGILPPEMARKVAERLFQQDMYSGWGIRTMGKREKAYNPMSYHNGSVWPHDNTIIAWGLRHHDLLQYLEQLATGLYDASLHFPYNRLPELFCGFTRRAIGGPVRYPIACDPQAWAVSSIFQLLQALLGLTCFPEGLQIKKPLLPSWLKEVYIEGLRVGKGRVDLEFARNRGSTYCQLLKKEGDFRVIIEV
ncbi:amylo-alpha-1,6-glucosidase [Desulfosoma caldarium]|uniref:Glycogen debranching enzyme n=1 Tax=Desulfosoma caldarium TaxID=610254 RepID=A0A3N1VQV5_9BACT|nr:amylo-alpha-1,6-glucosidase [Desulfosoma caldarium]ROR03438.1 glycogen debranching enzyme [Desulfosoma caldarium]